MKNGNYYKALNILGLLRDGTPLQQAVYQQVTVPAGMSSDFQQALQNGQDSAYWQSGDATAILDDLREWLSEPHYSQHAPY